MPQDKPESAAIERLDRFWEQLLDGGLPDDDELDPALATTVRQLYARYQPPLIDPTFHRRLAADLLEPASSVNMRRVSRAGERSNGRVSIRQETTRPTMRVTTERSVIPAWLTAALVLLVILAGGIGLNRTGILQRDAPQHLAAVVDNAESPAKATVLLHVPLSGWTVGPSVPAATSVDDTPGDPWRIDLYRLTLDSGTPYQDPAVDVGTVVTGVEHGVAAISVDGPAKLLRQGEDVTTDVPVGATSELTSGDALLTTGGQRRTIRAGSEEPVTILEVSAQRSGIKKGRFHLVATGVRPESLPPEPLALTIEQVRLPYAAELPMPPGATVVVRVERGVVTQTQGVPGTALLQPGQFFTYQTGGYFVAESVEGGPSDVQAVDGPAELLVVTFAPATAASR